MLLKCLVKTALYMKCDIVLVIQVHILDQTCSRTFIGETVMINRYEKKNNS